jgi:3-deoxy-D-manno-octulosonic-acid transferase
MGWTILYRFGLFLYHTGIRIASLWSKKAKEWISGRKQPWPEKPENKTVIWFHASSLGEFEQGRPIMEMWRRKFPEHHILLTFFSPSGFAISHENTPADTVMLLPKENRSNVRKWFKHWQPKTGIFFKYDFWLVYLQEAKKKDIPIFFTSVLLREEQFFFKPIGRGYLEILSKTICHWICQNEQSAGLLKKYGITEVSIGGDTRIDRVHQRSLEPFNDEIIEAFCKNSIVLIAGSSWPAEEEIIAGISAEFSDLKIIIAPHDVSENHINKIKKRFGTKAHSWSDGQALADNNILIINTIGKLSGLYRFGHFAFIGGGFGKGVHNTLEPASYGIAVAFGPKHQKFIEPSDMINMGFAYCIREANDLRNFIAKYLLEEHRTEARKNAASYFSLHIGATEKTLNCILTHLQISQEGQKKKSS